MSELVGRAECVGIGGEEKVAAGSFLFLHFPPLPHWG